MFSGPKALRLDSLSNTWVSGLLRCVQAALPAPASAEGRSPMCVDRASLRIHPRLPAAAGALRYGLLLLPDPPCIFNDIGSADPASSCDNNPLYLRFEDGSSRLVLTAADGSNLCYAWGLWYAYMDGESIFQRFGVPLEAEGYESLPGGGVCATVNDYDFRVGQRIITVEYSAQGDPVSWLTWQESTENRPGEILRRYEYDADRHRVKEEYLEDGELYTTTVYEYSGDLLVRMEQRLSTGGMVYETYGYDELGRLIEQNSYYPDAIGGPISSSGAFWYDDQGYRHAYAKDENGNLVGYEGQPIRKPQD